MADDWEFRAQRQNTALWGRRARKRVYWRALYWGRKTKYPRAANFLTPSNLTWAPQNPLMRGRRVKPRKRFVLRPLNYRAQWHKLDIDALPQPAGIGNLAWVRAPLFRGLKKARQRQRFNFNLRTYPRTKVPHAYPGVPPQPSNLSWYQQNKTVRRKPMRPRVRFFMKWLNVKPKHVIYFPPQPEAKDSTIEFVSQYGNYKKRGKSLRRRSFFAWNALKLRPQWRKIDITGQPLPEGKGSPVIWVPRPTHYKLRGKSLRKRFFLRWKWLSTKPPHVYPGVPPQPSNLTWAPQNPLMRGRRVKPRKRFIFNWKRLSSKPPHTIFPPRQPSNLTWRQMSPLVLRKPTKPRKRFFVDIKKLPKAKPPHAYAMGQQFKPSNLSWVQLKQVSRKQMRPRKRFRIMGRWPNMPAKLHIISYHVLPITQWIVTGPGKTKWRRAQPSLDIERGARPRLQK